MFGIAVAIFKILFTIAMFAIAAGIGFAVLAFIANALFTGTQPIVPAEKPKRPRRIVKPSKDDPLAESKIREFLSECPEGESEWNIYRKTTLNYECLMKALKGGEGTLFAKKEDGRWTLKATPSARI